MLVKDSASGSVESQDSIMSTKQSPNLLYLGPASGAGALATFRALQLADLPGGGGAGSAYFPMFWGFKAVNAGGGINTAASVLAMVGFSTTGTQSSQSATSGKALRARYLTSSTAGSSAGLCEQGFTAGTVLNPCIRTIGTTNVLLANITLQQTTNMRIWFGLTDQSPNVIAPTALTLTAAANASAGTTVYTGTITNGGSNGLAGQYVTVAGFLTGANNGGPWLCSASTATTITLANASGVAETHAGTATYGVAINFRSDTPFAKFVGFRYSTAAGDTKYQIVAQTSSANQTVTPESGSHTINTTDELQLAMHYDVSLATVFFYIGVDQVGSVATSNANLPGIGTPLQPFIVIDNVGTANAQSFEISQMRGQ